MKNKLSTIRTCPNFLSSVDFNARLVKPSSTIATTLDLFCANCTVHTISARMNLYCGVKSGLQCHPGVYYAQLLFFVYSIFSWLDPCFSHYTRSVPVFSQCIFIPGFSHGTFRSVFKNRPVPARSVTDFSHTRFYMRF